MAVCAQRSRHGAETGSLCESAGGPPALLYAGAQREGIIDTETNSLSSQPPQNRNTPIIKEREGEGEGEEEGGALIFVHVVCRVIRETLT